jgi:hypothetical protein
MASDAAGAGAGVAAAAAAAVPVPLSGTVRVLAIFSSPVRAPAASGANVTATVQLAPAAMVVPHVVAP